MQKISISRMINLKVSHDSHHHLSTQINMPIVVTTFDPKNPEWSPLCLEWVINVYDSVNETYDKIVMSYFYSDNYTELLKNISTSETKAENNDKNWKHCNVFPYVCMIYCKIYGAGSLFSCWHCDKCALLTSLKVVFNIAKNMKH